MSIEFIPAKHFTPADHRQIDLIVGHDMEAPETQSRARACGELFKVGARVASAHYGTDDNESIQYVRDHDVAYAAPGSNSNGLHFEHAGFAAQRAEDWRDHYSHAELELSAQLVATKVKENGIPVVWLTAVELKQGRRGITHHWEVSKAWHLTTHTDMGAAFGATVHADWVHAIADFVDHDHNKHVDHQRVELPTIRRGDVGWMVKKAQRHLKAHGFSVGPIDGHFGATTEEAVRRFQRFEHLDVDGIVGTKTWRRLRG